MRFGGGEFSTGTMGNFQPELTEGAEVLASLGMNERIGWQRPRYLMTGQQ